MNKFALKGFFLSFNLDGNGDIFEFDPCFTALMEKFAAQGLYLFDVASVNEDSSERPADFTIGAWKQKGDSRNSVCKDVSGLRMLEFDRVEGFLKKVFIFNELDQNGFSWLGDRPWGSKNQVFLEESDDRVKEISEHKLIDIVVELVREKFVETESSSRLFTIHPGVRFLCFIS